MQQEGLAMRRTNLARQSVDLRSAGGGGGGGGDGQSLEDMMGSRKKITTLEGIQRRGIKLDVIESGGGGRGRVQHPNLASLRTKVMPTHEKFNPNLYLGTVHWVCARLLHAATANHVCGGQHTLVSITVFLLRASMLKLPI